MLTCKSRAVIAGIVAVAHTVLLTMAPAILFVLVLGCAIGFGVLWRFEEQAFITRRLDEPDEPPNPGGGQRTKAPQTAPLSFFCTE